MHRLACRMAAVLFVTTYALSGCGALHNLSPERRLTDHVYLFNDEARWGRVDLAAMRCSESYRARFAQRHHTWGRGIRIADADVTNVIMGQERTSSLVTYSWIDERTMEMSETVVRQDWESSGDGFILINEEILGGGAIFGIDDETSEPPSDDSATRVIAAQADATRRDRPIDSQGRVQR